MTVPLVLCAGLADDVVLQRDAGDRAPTVHISGIAPGGQTGAVLATVSRQEAALPGWDGREVGQITAGEWSATLEGLPVGGPYLIELAPADAPEAAARVRGVLVGDLWVLAGQSNMEGCADLVDTEAPSPYVHLLDMARRWHVAEEPLHWLCDSPDSCHCEVTDEEQRRLAQEARRTRTKGAGLGLPFANAMVRETGVPVGLIACAHGGTSMQQWSPEKKDEGGASLYGSMLLSVRQAGGRVRGLLWYQGESDANPDDLARFDERFQALVANVREDFGDPQLPFYSVQIGRFALPPDAGSPSPDGWNGIQEHQRSLAEEILGTAVVPAIDLELDDLIHVGTEGQKRLGRRLARVALHAVRGGNGEAPWLRLRSVAVEGANRDCVRVSFAGVAPHGFPLSRRVTGFSLRDARGEEATLIYKAQVDPASRSDILLHLVWPLPEGLSLWHGYGFDPACGLVDSHDMAAPAFGPVPLA